MWNFKCVCNDQQFSILAKARTPFHLAALEAAYITIHQRVLCRHKEFVYVLQIEQPFSRLPIHKRVME